MKSLLVTITVILAGQLVSAQLCQFTDQFIQLTGLCNYYIRCSAGPPIVEQCPTGYVFSTVANGCVQPGSANDDCTVINTPPATTTTTTTAAPNPQKGNVDHVSGPLSASHDGAPSDVICPAGSYVINCACSSLDTCDGTLIVGNRCRAYNGQGGSGQHALGVCFFDDPGQFKTPTSGLRRSPEVNCPSGFEVVACTLYYGFSHLEKALPYANSARNSCQTTLNCRFGRGCRIQAVCRKQQLI